MSSNFAQDLEYLLGDFFLKSCRFKQNPRLLQYCEMIRKASEIANINCQCLRRESVLNSSISGKNLFS